MKKKLAKKAVKTVNVRAFSRGMYQYIDELPVAVYNAKTKQVMFIVIAYKEGEYDVRT